MTTLLSTWQAWAVLAAVFAALTALLAKVGVEGADPDAATLARTVVVALVLAALLGATGRLGGVAGLAELSGRSWTFLVLSGLATGASWVCYFRALKLGPASQVAPVDKLSVVMVAVLAATFLGETLSSTAWLGVALVGAGAVLVAVG